MLKVDDDIRVISKMTIPGLDAGFYKVTDIKTTVPYGQQIHLKKSNNGKLSKKYYIINASQIEFAIKTCDDINGIIILNNNLVTPNDEE